jgi:hypothetical protein
MLTINENNEYYWYDSKNNISFVGKKTCTLSTVYAAVSNYYLRNHIDDLDDFEKLWMKSLFSLLKTPNKIHFQKVSLELSDDLNDNIRYLIVTNKNVSTDILLKLKNDPNERINNLAKTKLLSRFTREELINVYNLKIDDKIKTEFDPMNLDSIDFIEWLENTSLDEIERFAYKKYENNNSRK